jgi:class 3 adenylate cyclase
MTQGPTDQRQTVLDAAGAGDWPRVHELLSSADEPLDADGHQLLATAAMLTGRPTEALTSFEAAYRAHLAAGNEEAAAESASRIAAMHLEGGSPNRAFAWLDRGDRLMEGKPESIVHGWLAISRSLGGLLTGDPEATREFGKRAEDIGRRFGHPGLEALGINGVARAAILDGDAANGLRMMDECAVAAAGGKLDPVSAGYIFCSVVCASQSVGDYRMSEHWTEEMRRWTANTPLPYFPGRCRVHRAELSRLRGDWREAEREAQLACDELRGCGPVDIGWALAELGLIRLRLGDLEGADEAFRESNERGRVPHPGMALLHLARGDLERASRAIADALEDPPEWPSWEAPLNSRLGRALLLPVQVEIAIAVGDTDRARSAADELANLAQDYPTVGMQAVATESRGRVELASGVAREAVRTLKSALRRWADAKAPYEVARVRLVLAEAHRASGDEASAIDELDAAHDALARLGARLELQRAAALGATGREAGTATSRTFVFTDIVRSTDLAELIGDEAWRQLKHWHDNLVRSVVTEHGGEVVKGTGDGFFLSFADSTSALSASVAIQRALAEHRRTAGFAPSVRIGVHAAEALHDGTDYAGVGVHAAARIAAAAGAEEVLASVSTLEAAARPFEHDAPRSVELKGIAEPMAVASLRWH